MAGDWIKMRGALIDHPKVIAMCRALMATREFREWLTPGGSGHENGQIVSTHALRCVTTALLMRCWSVAREHGKFVGDDLVLQHSTISDIDEMAGAPGVGRAMQTIGWALDANGLTLPNFIEFNVPLTNAEKQADYRARQKALQHEGKTLPTRSNEKAQNVTTREEKRREENKEQEHVQRAARFKEFWEAYPSKKGKKPAREKWQAKKLDELADTIIADVKARAEQDRSWRDGFVPNPATYLHQERWTDEIQRANVIQHHAATDGQSPAATRRLA